MPARVSVRTSTAGPDSHTEGEDRANREGEGGMSGLAQRDGTVHLHLAPARYCTHVNLHLALGASAHLLPFEPLTDTELPATRARVGQQLARTAIAATLAYSWGTPWSDGQKRDRGAAERSHR